MQNRNSCLLQSHFYSAPLSSDDVRQLRGCCLVTEAIFFKVQISPKTIKQAFPDSHLQCLASLHSQLLQTNSPWDKCQLCVSLPWFCPGTGIPGAEITSLCPAHYRCLAHMIVFQCLIQRSQKLMERFTLTSAHN